MHALNRLIRRAVIRMQLRSLERQSDCIIAARAQALARLVEIERERCHKKEQLWRFASPALRSVR